MAEKLGEGEPLRVDDETSKFKIEDNALTVTSATNQTSQESDSMIDVTSSIVTGPSEQQSLEARPKRCQ